MKKISGILLFVFLTMLPVEAWSSIRIWAIGDGVRVDPESGELIENMQTFFGPVVEEGYRYNNWVWDSDGSTIYLKAARNEVVSCQVIIETDKPVQNCNLKVTDLAGFDGAEVPSSNINLFRQWYHFVPISKAPNQGVRYPLKAGWYPDALIPLNAAQHGAPFDIPGKDYYSVNEAGESEQTLSTQVNQAIWLDLYVPDDVPTGSYKGELTFSADNELERDINIELEVFDFTIPDKFHTTWEFMEYGRISGGPEDIELKTYRLAQQHRVTVSSTGMKPDTVGIGYNIELAWDKFDKRWGKFFDGSAFIEGPGKNQPLTHLLLPFDARVWREDKKPAWWGKDWPFALPGDSLDKDFTPEYEEAFIEKLVDFERHFAEKGWKSTKMMFWPGGVDEPQPNNGVAGIKPLNMAKHYGSLLKRSGVKMIKYRLDIGSGLRSSVDINGDGRIEPDTKEVVDYIKDVIDVWNCSGKWIIPDILNMRPGEHRWTDVWFYNGYDPAIGSGLVNGESLGFRTWQWATWKYGLSGVCDWEFGITQRKNVFRQMIIEDSDGYPYLRNTYVYPGSQIGLEGEPLPSIRLKMIRRSNQDYEYLWLLTDKLADGGKAADQVVNRVFHRGLRESVPNWPPEKDDPTNWSHCPAEWYKARLELANLIVN